jgi:glycosyltransferase involved in cell wall biosynthesis
VTPDRPLSILLVGDYPADPTLGSSKVFFKLREEFVALGHRCDVLWSDDIGRRPVSRQIRQGLSPWMAARAIAARTARDHYDVVDAASAEGLFLGLIGLIVRNEFAYVCRSNGLEHLNYRRMLDDHTAGLTHKPWTRRVWYPLTRLSQVAAAARLADALILLNDVDRHFALDHGWQPADRVFIVPHGVSAKLISEGPPPGSPRGAGLLFCGSWTEMKGVSYLAAAFDRLHETGHDSRLTVLGPGVPADAVLRAFSEGARPYVTVIDRVPEERVMQEYRRHDALLFTSTYEGFGLVVIEAMSQRLPVIATPMGCAATMIRNGETGVVVPPRNPDAIVSAILCLRDNPQEAGRLADNARARIAGMTWRVTAERTLAVYRAAISRVRE